MWFIFRHGQTMHNASDVMQGRYDSLLSIKGIDQAKSYGYRLAEHGPFEKYRFFSSPRVRARHTMQIINEITGTDFMGVEIEDLLDEVDTGELVNIKKSEVRKMIPDYYNKKCRDFWSFRRSSGETYNEVFERVEQFCEKYKDEENLIITTHGCCFLFFRMIFEGRQKGCDISETDTNPSQNYFFSWDGKNIVDR